MGPVSGFDIAEAIRRLNAENRDEERRIVERRRSALEEAQRLAAVMRAKEPGISAIYGFGSTFDGSRPYRMDSDIDLAIEGGDLVRLLSIVEDSEFKVDLVDIAGADDGFARAIRAGGTRLY